MDPSNFGKDPRPPLQGPKTTIWLPMFYYVPHPYGSKGDNIASRLGTSPA